MPAASSSGGVSLSVMPLIAGAQRLEQVLLDVERAEEQDADRRPVERDDPPRRLDPVHVGHPHVHQHDVGAQALGLGDGGDAVARLADDLHGGLHLEPHPDPLAHQLEVVDDQDPDAHDTPAVRRSSGSRAATSKPPSGRGPVCDVAAEHPHPLAHAHEAVPGARELRARAAVAAVGDAHLERVLAPLEPHLRRRAAGVLDGVGQRLLHDAVDGELGARAEEAALAADLERHGQARLARALDQLAQPVELGRRGPVGGGLEHAQEDVHLGERVGAGAADARRGLLGAPRIGGEDPAGAAGLDDHHADAVRDDVVHLARDPAALLGDRLLRLALAPLGGERRRLVQLGGVARAGADGPAAEPAQRGDDGREVEVAGGLAPSSNRPTVTTPASSTPRMIRASRSRRRRRRCRRGSGAGGRWRSARRGRTAWPPPGPRGAATPRPSRADGCAATAAAGTSPPRRARSPSAAR